ncbi:DUF3180 domain-containing protein [Microbacterium sp. zg.Y1090]|uniref:DUF3180 domain-containing protein n=1 Tax=Microbacterium TaxID=33882 RepID=UPI00214B4F90|nr:MULTISPECIES: DUF3180 domain-containing protein [unclassified Microbacterium]MCR2813909.1 DUF3180 domain-containing protein [Microbacterium sp. zg.Y1084]MCR2819183.1 DUF3180 domain-containing protein [Microbacterium sp. zg.Y1090]MDL5487092.1 DUF3180 domain-containing protein [Microbacterium sp. zg-Y1211]WIM28167.1 DUF3180 domain-containing protein [Microbacterium sp. zg-Y1090]
MKRTGAAVLAVAGVLGLGAGFIVDQALTAAGRPTFTPSLMLPVLLVALGAILIVLALPISRATRGVASPEAPPVNPFQALRIAMLAKASSILGAAVAGFAVGMGAFVATRPSDPSLGSLSTLVAAAVGGAILVAAGLVAEQLCTIRKDDDDEPPAPGPDTTPSHH